MDIKIPDLQLSRSVSLVIITFYGLGTILGAGIYVLISEISSVSGIYSPIAFILSAIIVSFSAFSYAELSSRFPRSAGEATYIQVAFSIKWLSALAGWTIVLIGIVSAATISNGFVGYFQVFFHIPDWLCIFILVTTLGIIALLGVNLSLKAAAVMTVFELVGIGLVIYFGLDSLQSFSGRYTEFIPPGDFYLWNNIFAGAFIAFYAYVGFEDIVNMAEEVKNARKNLPLAIIISLFFTTICYILVSFIAVTSIPPEILNTSRSPFTTLIEQNSNFSPTIITLISIMAIINGALVQIIMGSRVLYGMGSQKLSVSFFSHINKKTKTPDFATAFVAIVVLMLALFFPLVSLAKTTSFLTLTIFMLINYSLFHLKIKRRLSDRSSYLNLPVIFPLIGFILCAFLIIVQIIK